MNHTYTDWQQKTYKITVGRIYVIESDNDYPYELNLIHKIRSTYTSIFDQHTDQ